MNTYTQLQEINRRPEPFEHYTADELWTDEHTSASMLEHHLDASSDLSSRNAAFIERSAAWIARRFGLGPGRHVADFGCGPVVLDKYTLFEENRTRTVYNWLQYFSEETLRAELEKGGFVVEEVLGDVAGGAADPEADEMAVIARRGGNG